MLPSVVCCDVVRGVPCSSTHSIWIRSPHLGCRALSLLLLPSTLCDGEFLDITFCFLCAGGRNLVCAFAVEAARDATAWIDALDGLGAVRIDAIPLGALAVVWRGPTRRESRNSLWLFGD